MRFLLALMLMIGTAKAGVVNLTSNNYVSLVGEVNAESVNKVIIELSKNKEVKYLTIHSQGGSIVDGLKLVNFLRSRPKIKCVATFAASMAFSIFQSCKNRMVVDSTVLMQHEALVGFDMTSLSVLKAKLRAIEDQSKEANKFEAKRLKLSLKTYRKLIRDEFWLFSGQSAISKNAADKLISLTCSDEVLLKEGTLSVPTPFGKMDVPYPACPILL